MFGLKEEHIEAINKCFAQYPTIEQVVIYGSRAKENYKNGSDIDLTIIAKEMSYDELLKLENEIDDLLLPYKIDLSLKKNISNPELTAHINRVGKIFYDKINQLILNEPPVEYKTQGSKDEENIK